MSSEFVLLKSWRREFGAGDNLSLKGRGLGWGGHELVSTQGLGVGLQALRAKAEQIMVVPGQGSSESECRHSSAAWSHLPARGKVPTTEPGTAGRKGQGWEGRKGGTRAGWADERQTEMQEVSVFCG